MTEATTTAVKAKRITLADVNSAFHNLTEFSAGNGTVVGVARPVQTLGNVPLRFRRLYTHHVVSQSFTVLFTVVSKGVVIGWSYLRHGSNVPVFVVIGTHNGNHVIKP